MMISTNGSTLMAVFAFTMVLLVPGCHKQTPSDTNATKATSDATLPSNDENSGGRTPHPGTGDNEEGSPEAYGNSDGSEEPDIESDDVEEAPPENYQEGESGEWFGEDV